MKIILQVWLAFPFLIFARLVTLARTNPHSAPMWRVNGTVSNMPSFYEAFNVKPTDPMYRSDSLRVKIW
jgi:putative endopeptidase